MGDDAHEVLCAKRSRDMQVAVWVTRTQRTHRRMIQAMDLQIGCVLGLAPNGAGAPSGVLS